MGHKRNDATLTLEGLCMTQGGTQDSLFLEVATHLAWKRGAHQRVTGRQVAGFLS
jgi:hypothetical protein